MKVDFKINFLSVFQKTYDVRWVLILKLKKKIEIIKLAVINIL